SRRLPDPRQPPAGQQGPDPPGRRPRQHDAHQDRRRDLDLLISILTVRSIRQPKQRLSDAPLSSRGSSMLSTQHLVRIASRLHDVWEKKSAQSCHVDQSALEYLSMYHRGVERDRRLLNKAQARNLSLILPELRHNLFCAVSALQQAALKAHQTLEQP